MGIKVKLLRPLDGMPIGSVVEYPEEDAKRLESAGVVTFQSKAARVPNNKMAPKPQNKVAAAGAAKKGR